MGKKLIMVHGRHFKPEKSVLEQNWIEAIRFGIARDFGEDTASSFDAIESSMAYYGNFSNKFLREKKRKYNEENDVKDRGVALGQLQKYHDKQDFLSADGMKNYKKLPGKNSWYEALADSAGEVVEFLHLGKSLVSFVAPDMAEYWNDEAEFSSNVRWPLTKLLAEALRNDDDVLLVAHSLGSLISYDVLWKFSHYGEYQDIADKKISEFITIGSPLGDETSKRNLKGSHIKGPRRYPHNIRRWINLAAEDDYVAHDEKLGNDFEEMVGFGLVEPIQDKGIYNLSIRGGKSNPHHGAGYLIHPFMAELVVKWLEQ